MDGKSLKNNMKIQFLQQMMLSLLFNGESYYLSQETKAICDKIYECAKGNAELVEKADKRSQMTLYKKTLRYLTDIQAFKEIQQLGDYVSKLFCFKS